jgi:hypothetical protein
MHFSECCSTQSPGRNLFLVLLCYTLDQGAAECVQTNLYNNARLPSMLGYAASPCSPRNPSSASALSWRQGSQGDAFFLPAPVALLPLVTFKASKKAACFGCSTRDHLHLLLPDPPADEHHAVLLKSVLLQDGAEDLAEGLGRLWRIPDEVHCFMYGLADERRLPLWVNGRGSALRRKTVCVIGQVLVLVC